VSRDVALEMSGRLLWKAWAGVISFVTAFDNSVLVGYVVVPMHSIGSHENVTQIVCVRRNDVIGRSGKMDLSCGLCSIKGQCLDSIVLMCGISGWHVATHGTREEACLVL
jgi:hypothetical protein